MDVREVLEVRGSDADRPELEFCDVQESGVKGSELVRK